MAVTAFAAQIEPAYNWHQVFWSENMATVRALRPAAHPIFAFVQPPHKGIHKTPQAKAQDAEQKRNHATILPHLYGLD